MQIQTRAMYYNYNYNENSQMMMSSSPPPSLPCIQHPISKLDTLAGIAIKYGVEVPDIKRINGLVTDSHMFALKTIDIPPNGKHPSSPSLRNNAGTGTGGHDEYDLLFESFQPMGKRSSSSSSSPMIRSLQGRCGIKPTMKKSASEIFSMAEYERRMAHRSSENCSLYRKSPMSSCHHNKNKSSGVVAAVEKIMKNDDYDKRKNGTLTRRNYKSEANLQRIPELLLKQDSNNCNGGFSFSPRAAKGLAQRQKSATSRIALTAHINQVV